ncbi:enoyl-CoA hydratase/isomerase family protein [Phytohabitans houttuyneae]|uniref:Enoyl-CoA hydratase n=1 Tax=Phytohabitans houttuyneae TaxID=1076126 RepID=A0A6V8JZV2_9ACTN|nr:enoyl-CoA hydratase/isomerase family protein [Phytohabitans houttuyneae]GFJ76854.1 enoyl-CoA hydratase [Phytohabitans houttuyneae]
MGVLGVERRGPVAVLRLHRPDRRNALDAALVEELDAALAAADGDPEVHAAVLTGAPPGFCAGSDLRELAGLPRAGIVRHEERTGLVARRLQWLSKPVVAAVEGFAIGGGFFLAASCDLVVSAGDARWHLPEVPLGWVPPWGLQALVARVGPVAARRLVWGADPLPVRELHRLGAVDELAPPGTAEAHALDLAARLSALPPHAVAATKRALADAAAGPAEALDARAARQFGDDIGTPAARATFERYRA